MSDSDAIAGRYFPYGSGCCVMTTAILREGRLHIAALDDVVSILAITPALAGLPRKLTLSDGGVFEPDSPAAFNAGERLAWRDRLERGSGTPWLMTLACMALIFSLLHWGVPLGAGFAAGYAPPDVLKRVDASATAIARRALEPTQVPEQRRQQIRAVMAGLLPQADLSVSTPQILFGRWAGGPNAFALPAGTIVITDAMVQLVRTDDEIAGVLAHEIAHVALRHAAKRVLSEMSVIALLASLSGGDPLMAAAASQAGLLEELAYSRSDESEADARAVAILRKAGRDPAGLAAVLERLDALSGGREPPRFLTTHPGGAERRARILGSEAAR